MPTTPYESFYTPSTTLVHELFREEFDRRGIEATEDVLEELRQEVKRRVWMFSGTLARDGAAEYARTGVAVTGHAHAVDKEKLTNGLSERLAIGKNPIEKLVSDFTNWLIRIGNFTTDKWRVSYSADRGFQFEYNVKQDDASLTRREPAEVLWSDELKGDLKEFLRKRTDS